MSMESLLADYLAGPEALRRAIAGLTHEQLISRPIPDRWSTMEVLCHIADFEPILADRIKRTIALEQPSLLGSDENRFVERLAYHDRDAEEELALIDITRKQLARILRHQPDDVLQRVGVHSERGPRTVETLIKTAINHIPHHIKFIEAKRQAMK